MKRWEASTIAFWRYLTCCVSGGGCTLSLWVFHHSPASRTCLQCILVSFNGLKRREARVSAFWRYFAFSVWWAGSLGKSILHCFPWSWACLTVLLYSLKGPKRREVRVSAIWRYFIYSVLVGWHFRFSVYFYAGFLIWKSTLASENCTLHCHQQSAPSSFFPPDFCIFDCIFSF